MLYVKMKIFECVVKKQYKNNNFGNFHSLFLNNKKKILETKIIIYKNIYKILTYIYI